MLLTMGTYVYGVSLPLSSFCRLWGPLLGNMNHDFSWYGCMSIVYKTLSIEKCMRAFKSAD